jgi:hypothetical protein
VGAITVAAMLAWERVRPASLEGVATFMHLPRIAKTLEVTAAEGAVRLNLKRLAALDHTCAELLGEWLRGLRSAGAQVGGGRARDGPPAAVARR